MRHRIASLMTVPALLAAGLVTVPAAEATTAPVPVRQTPIHCTLRTMQNEAASLARCRESRDYEHWLRCRDRRSRVTVEVTRSFTGTSSMLSCPRNYRLVNHAVGM
ncbi:MULTISPECIES: hypothetical protein [Thermomonospora]|uniref:Uncharacterized protein n=1 Tax=Thermomonospora cellulosilytica TaxID=1411118 RepID=A0A7W3MVN3_9ACTN|nr:MULTISPECIES: hypothetical protein [Thermomonospora]MBA9002738.1 hypothetical protein [Thermomonospora cellulosilytica]